MNRNQLIESIIISIRSHKDYAESRRDKDMSLALRNDEFKALEKERRALIPVIAYEEFNGINPIDKKARYEQITKRLTAIADKLNLKPFEAQYNCNICKDNGYIGNKLCKCAREILFGRLKAMSGNHSRLNTSFAMHNDQLFIGTRQERTINRLYNYLKRYSEAFPKVVYSNIILSGGTGTGKTFALSALGNAILTKGYMILYLSAFDMHNAFLSYHTSPIQEKFIHMDNILSTDLLIIDDLGTEPIFKNVTIEYLHLTLEQRLINNLPTLISTNLTPDQLLARYGERIFSRLVDKRHSRLINIDGDDLRLSRS